MSPYSWSVSLGSRKNIETISRDTAQNGLAKGPLWVRMNWAKDFIVAFSWLATIGGLPLPSEVFWRDLLPNVASTSNSRSTNTCKCEGMYDTPVLCTGHRICHLDMPLQCMNHYFILIMHVAVLSARMSVNHIQTFPEDFRRGCWIPLLPELLMMVNCDVGARNKIPALCKSSQCSELLSHSSSSDMWIMVVPKWVTVADTGRLLTDSKQMHTSLSSRIFAFVTGNSHLGFMLSSFILNHNL